MSDLMKTSVTMVPTARLSADLDALDNAPVLCVDVSSSMNTMLRSGEIRRLDRMREIVSRLNQEGIDFRQVVFSSEARESTVIPDAYGGTALHEALKLALTMTDKKIAVVSDGEPDSESEAMKHAAEAKARGIVIDTMFCGDHGTQGEAFLRDLAAATGGKTSTVDLDLDIKALTTGARLMLTDGTPSKAIVL